MNVWHADEFMLVHDDSFETEMGPYGAVNIERQNIKYRSKDENTGFSNRNRNTLWYIDVYENFK